MQQIASEAFEQLPLKPSATANADTRSVCLAIPLKRGRVGTEDFLYIDVLTSLPQKPKEPDHGFAEEDLISQVQVYVLKRGSRAYLRTRFSSRSAAARIDGCIIA